MGKNFQKLYREKRKEKEQRQKEQSQMGKPVVTEGNPSPKAAASASEKTAPQPHSIEQSGQGQDTTSPPPDLLRAKDALGKIDSLKTEAINGHGYGNYVSYVEALPAAILQNGLGQAMATLLAGANLNAEPPEKRTDDEKARKSLYDQINTWLCRDDEDSPYRGQTDLMQAIVHRDEDSYLHAQAEALAYLRWLKKLAVAFLKKKENG